MMDFDDNSIIQAIYKRTEIARRYFPEVRLGDEKWTLLASRDDCMKHSFDDQVSPSSFMASGWIYLIFQGGLIYKAPLEDEGVDRSQHPA
jgi:hypothetical protein